MNKYLLVVLLLVCCCGFLRAQQNVTVISRCGGIDTLTIPAITDNDQDGMDDALEQLLIEHFMPTFIEFNNESCPGSALDGTGDSNLVVCHIYPLPQQYAFSNDLDSVLRHPVPVVPKKGLVTGLIWYETLIKINAALLYGKDCGLAGHTADVEGFNYSLKYIGPDTLAGWMYDTVLLHWMGGTIQSVSHEGTLCEQVETYPYKSALFPTGKDTLYCSPDKHGNYLTIGGCGASFICNPGCGGAPSYKNVRGINLGEPDATLISDLGTAYAVYAGNDPWGSAKFLAANGGSAGTISTKMLLELTDKFISGSTITSQNQICDIYSRCFATGSAYLDYSCAGEAYLFYNETLSNSGIYYHTLTSSYGCDSIIRLDLTVRPLSSSTSAVTTCAQYDFNGEVLTASGIYTDTLTNSTGCDSVATLTLTVNQPVVRAYSAVVCAGSVYQFKCASLTTSGVYTDSLITVNGCDSIVVLSLLVDTVPQVTLTIDDDSMATDGHTILLAGGNPAGGNYYGAGVSGNLFFPAIAGEGVYTITYVYVDSIGCSDTATAQITIISTGIGEINSAGPVMVYPNPASSMVTVTAPGQFDVIFYNVHGAVVKKTLMVRNTKTIDISDLSAGIYSVQVSNGYFRTNKKLVVR